MRSSEYPDLAFRPPRSWTRGRPAPPRVVVIHTTEGHEGNTAAEDGAAYDGRRRDGTSAHYYHDPDSTVQCVLTTDTAHTARYTGNRIGIHHELAGRAGQTVAQWDDDASNAIIRRAARQVARDCRRWDIPAVRLTAAQVAGGRRGICGHIDITRAFPADQGTHWDPGPRFPWDEFMTLLRAELATTEEENDMGVLDEIITLVQKPDVKYSAKTMKVRSLLASISYYGLQTRNKVLAELAAVRAENRAVLAAVKGQDTAAILSRIDQRSQEDAARDAQLIELVRQVKAGRLAPEEAVRQTGILLDAASDGPVAADLDDPAPAAAG